MIIITLGSIVQWLGHWLSIKEILGSNYCDIKFNEFIDNLLCEKSNVSIRMLVQFLIKIIKNKSQIKFNTWLL